VQKDKVPFYSFPFNKPGQRAGLREVRCGATSLVCSWGSVCTSDGAAGVRKDIRRLPFELLVASSRSSAVFGSKEPATSLLPGCSSGGLLGCCWLWRWALVVGRLLPASAPAKAGVCKQQSPLLAPCAAESGGEGTLTVENPVSGLQGPVLATGLL